MAMERALVAYLEKKQEELKQDLLKDISDNPELILGFETVKKILTVLDCDINLSEAQPGDIFHFTFRNSKRYFDIKISQNNRGLIAGISYETIGEWPDAREKEMIDSLPKIEKDDKPLYDFIVSEARFKQIHIEGQICPGLVALFEGKFTAFAADAGKT